jgi:hypothetical protein
MLPDAGTKRFRTAITLTIWWVDTSIILKGVSVTTTGR